MGFKFKSIYSYYPITEIEKLTQQVANLEIQLNNTSHSEQSLQSDAAISRDLCLKLENSVSKLRLELANAESSRAAVIFKLIISVVHTVQDYD